MGAAPVVRMTYAEYLAAERVSEVKHEYLRGEIFAMSGGTPEHSRLAANVIYEVRRALGERPCVVFTSDARIRITATDRATYPDVSVVCGKAETAADDPDAITNPVVLVEVLSDSTEASDRGDKFAQYQLLPQLRAYVLVSHRDRRVEVWSRDLAGPWQHRAATRGMSVPVEPIGLSIAVDALYDSSPVTRGI